MWIYFVWFPNGSFPCCVRNKMTFYFPKAISFLIRSVGFSTLETRENADFIETAYTLRTTACFFCTWIFFCTRKRIQTQCYASHKILSLKINSSGSLWITSLSYLNIITLYLWPLRICKTWGTVFCCLFYMLCVLFFKFCHVPFNCKLSLENLWSVSI